MEREIIGLLRDWKQEKVAAVKSLETHKKLIGKIRSAKCKKKKDDALDFCEPIF